MRAAAESYRDDVAACREILRVGSRSFHAASLLLPERVREPASIVYAFCRVSDDAVDLVSPRESPAAVERLRGRLARVYEARPDNHPVDRALTVVVERHGLPRAVPEALLDGFAWDVEGRRYESREALYDYCARVAGTVGAMMTVLMGRRAAGTVARACDLGVAMQLTNICRDVGEDARNGRVYLPLDMLDAVGLDPEALVRAPQASPALAAVVEYLLRDADRLYTRADAGMRDAPPRLPRGHRRGAVAVRGHRRRGTTRRARRRHPTGGTARVA
jgi:phytoene synthase